MLVAATITGALLVSMDQRRGEIAVLLAVLMTIAFAWLGMTHVVTLRAVAGSLRRHYAAGVLGAVGLVMVSALAGTRLMVVSRRDAEPWPAARTASCSPSVTLPSTRRPAPAWRVASRPS